MQPARHCTLCGLCFCLACLEICGPDPKLPALHQICCCHASQHGCTNDGHPLKAVLSKLACDAGSSMGLCIMGCSCCACLHSLQHIVADVALTKRRSSCQYLFLGVAELKIFSWLVESVLKFLLALCSGPSSHYIGRLLCPSIT